MKYLKLIILTCLLQLNRFISMMKPSTKISNDIIKLSLPVIVGMISHTLLNIVDTAMVGRLGDIALAAVGLTSYVILVSILIFGSIHIGTQAITSRRLGEKRYEEFKRIIYSTFTLSMIIGVIVSISGFLLSPWIIRLLSNDSEIVKTGTRYLEIRYIGIFSMIAIFAIRGFVYGLARVKIDMIVSVLINLVNIILNYFLIFGHWIFPRLEVQGAAIASVISTCVGLVIYLTFVLLRIVKHLSEESKTPLISREIMWQIIKISAPRAGQSVSIIGFAIFLSLIGRIGVKELAISNIIFKAFNFSFMIGIAIGTASATLVGRSLGERNPTLASRYGWHSVGLGSLTMGTIGVLFIFFPKEIMGIFTSNEKTIATGVIPFRLLGAFQFIDAIGIVISRTLQGVGSTLYVMISELICIWGVLIPSSYYAVEIAKGDIVDAWWALFMYIIAFASAMIWKFKEGGWKKIEI